MESDRFCQTLLLFSVWTCFNDTLFSLSASGDCSAFWHAPPSLNKSVHTHSTLQFLVLLWLSSFSSKTVIFLFLKFESSFNCSLIAVAAYCTLWSQLESRNPLLQWSFEQVWQVAAWCVCLWGYCNTSKGSTVGDHWLIYICVYSPSCQWFSDFVLLLHIDIYNRSIWNPHFDLEADLFQGDWFSCARVLWSIKFLFPHALAHFFKRQVRILCKMEDTIERSFIYNPGLTLEKYRFEISLTADVGVDICWI